MKASWTPSEKTQCLVPEIMEDMVLAETRRTKGKSGSWEYQSVFPWVLNLCIFSVLQFKENSWISWFSMVWGIFVRISNHNLPCWFHLKLIRYVVWELYLSNLPWFLRLWDKHTELLPIERDHHAVTEEMARQQKSRKDFKQVDLEGERLHLASSISRLMF